jgi:hypothetical protein
LHHLDVLASYKDFFSCFHTYYATRRYPPAGFTAVNLTAESADPVSRWRAGIYARGRLPTSFRALLDADPAKSALPGPTLMGSTLSFAVPTSEEAQCRHALKAFTSDMTTHYGGVASLEVTFGEPGKSNAAHCRLPPGASARLTSAINSVDAYAAQRWQSGEYCEEQGTRADVELRDLTPGERSWVHGYAARLNLTSQSRGEGHERHVIVTAPAVARV